MLWLNAGSSTLVTALLLLFERNKFPWALWLGALSALVTLYYYGALAYYLTHRAEIAANPPAPRISNRNLVYWTLGIVGAVVIVFVLLEAFVWRS